jgi:predicted Zn-dependent protease with MMP-like domain
MSDKEFEEIVDWAVDNIPEPYKSRVQNIAFIVEDVPSEEQRARLGLMPGQTLFGLYEGVPLPQRGGQVKLLPDKITIYKLPIMAAFSSVEAIREQVFKTVWHEVAHYFGLGHKRIHELENKQLD